MDSAEEELKRRGVDWKTKSGNRMDWKSEVRAVKAGTRLKYQYEYDVCPTMFYCKILLFLCTQQL
jgi:uncharacterized protein YndB with AHSA1/START domain